MEWCLFKIRLNETFGYYGEHYLRLGNSIDNVNSFIGRNNKIYNRFGLNIYLNKYFDVVIGPALIMNFSPEDNNDLYDRIAYEPRI